MTYPTEIDSAHIVQDGAAITAAHYGSVGGVARVFDFGADASWVGIWITRVTAITLGVGRSYARKFEFSATSDFSGTIVEAQPYTLSASPGTDGEIAVLLSNKIGETKYRYGREKTTPAGSGASITIRSWIIHTNALAAMNTPDLASIMGVVTERFNQATSLLRAWSGGVANGGPDGDGKYPLSDAAGNTYLIECPAKLVTMLSGGGMSLEDIDALPDATEEDVGLGSPDPIMIGIVGSGPGRLLKSIPRAFITSPRTKDLLKFTGLLSDELIPSVRESNGLERSIAVREIMRQSLGMLNPLAYGVKNDAFSTRHCFNMENGDDVLNWSEAGFEVADVGKVVQVGGAFGGGVAGQGTILEYLDNENVRVSFTATSDAFLQDGNFGTLCTAQMQAALDACFNPRGLYNYGAICMLPDGGVLTGALHYWPRTGLIGHGSRQSTLIRYNDSFLSNAFQHWDGDTNYWPITQYADGSYYYPIYPNAYKAPYYTGSYAPEIAPTLCNRIGKDRWGDTWSTEGTVDGPAQRGFKVDSDFNVFNDFAIDGSRYCSTRFMPGLEFRGGLFSMREGVSTAPYAQVDPYLRCRDLTLFLHGGVPFRTFGQCSGIISGIDSEENNICGYEHNAFDCNISNCYFMGNNGPGIVAGGSNTNWTTMKISFNADGSNDYYWGPVGGKANLYVTGIGHNFNNARIQESYGSNIAVMGEGCEFTGCHADDTGCVYPVHIAGGNPTTIAANMNWVTPAIFVGPNGKNLRLNDFGMGGLVHVGQNYASHAIFWSNDGSTMGEYTSGRMFTKSIGAWYNSGHGDLVGDYAANEWGAEGGVAPVGTSVTLNGVDITTL